MSKFFEATFTKLIKEAATPPPPQTDEEAANQVLDDVDQSELGASQEHIEDTNEVADETSQMVQEWIDDIEAMTARLNDPKGSILHDIKRNAAMNPQIQEILDSGVTSQITKCAQSLGALVETLKSAI